MSQHNTRWSAFNYVELVKPVFKGHCKVKNKIGEIFERQLRKTIDLTTQAGLTVLYRNTLSTMLKYLIQ